MKQTAQSRLPYLLLLLVFGLSRVAYYLLGVRFDARPLGTFFQIIDPELLRHRLLESLYYLHTQPPGFNSYAGVILKLFPNHYAAAFHTVNLALGAAICCLLFCLMRVFGVRTGIAFTLSAWFTVSPGVVLFENFLLYEYQLVFLLLLASAALYCFILLEKTIYAVAFFSCLFLLVWTRNHFHLIYLLLAFVLLLYFCAGRRKAIVLAAAAPLVLTLALYLKNWLLFDTFSSSNWMGMNMDVITSHQLRPAEAHRLINAGVITPVSLIDAGAPVSAYARFITPPPKTGIPILDEEVTSTGGPNFDNMAFFQIERYYTHDGLAILRRYPRAYLRSLEISWFTYFLPSSDFPFFSLNRPKIRAFDRVFNVVFFGQWKDASDRKSLRAMEAGGNRLQLILYTGTFLMLGLPLLWAGGICYLILGARTKALDRAAAALLGFLLFNITYLTAIANFLSSFENNRYRFQVDAFFVILFAIALEQLIRRFSRGRVS